MEDTLDFGGNALSFSFVEDPNAAPAMQQDPFGPSVTGADMTVGGNDDTSFVLAQDPNDFSASVDPLGGYASGSFSLPPEVREELFGSDASDADISAKTKEAIVASNNGDNKATDWVATLTKALGGEKNVAALIQVGFGMLAGASNAKMQEQVLEKKWANDRAKRDADWARKDQHAAAGSVKKMTWGGGLLGTAAK